jgi:methyl-accepting chemotaxis protein
MRKRVAELRLPVMTKLLGVSGLSVVLLVAVGAVGIAGLSSVDGQARSMYVDGVAPTIRIADAFQLFQADRSLVRSLMLENDKVLNGRQVAELTANKRRVVADVAQARPGMRTAKERRLLARYAADDRAYNQADAVVVSLARSGQTDQAYALTKATVDPSAAKVQQDLQAIFDVESAATKHGAASVHATYVSRRTLVLVLLALAIAFSLAASVLMARQLRSAVGAVLTTLSSLKDHCIEGIRVAVAAVAEGDLTRTVTPVTAPARIVANDEIGDTARAVNEARDKVIETIGGYNAMRESLLEMIGKVHATAGTLSAASQQMASTSEEAGRAVGEIANAVSDVAHGAERQVRVVDEAKLAADETGSVAAHAGTLADEGVAAVEEADESMRALAAAAAEVSDAVNGLGAKSEQIGGIVETITGIAGQTNLLALNAAIEAARAGEQGRGFAVVAEEVRKLAEESQHAAATISTLIAEIQADTARTVEKVEEAGRLTAESSVRTAGAREAFSRIGDAVADVRSRVERILAATDEVMAVAEQSSASTEEVSASTEETSASTQEIAASAQELAHTAEELERLVTRFQTA